MELLLVIFIFIAYCNKQLIFTEWVPIRRRPGWIPRRCSDFTVFFCFFFPKKYSFL